MVLTKNEILNGIETIQTVEIETLDSEIELRLLSQSELFELDEVESKALGVLKTNESASRGGRRIKASELSSQGNIDVHRLTLAGQQAKIKAVQWSLTIGETKWTEKEVSSMPGPVFNEIYEKVREINHLGEDVNLEREIEEFP